MGEKKNREGEREKRKWKGEGKEKVGGGKERSREEEGNIAKKKLSYLYTVGWKGEEEGEEKGRRNIITVITFGSHHHGNRHMAGRRVNNRKNHWLQSIYARPPSG